MQIELNQNEAQVLLGLIDLAIRQGGLNVSDSANYMALKIKTAVDAEKKAMSDAK